jgi:hypothetical protein
VPDLSSKTCSVNA